MNPLIHGEVGWLLGHRLAARRDRVLVALAGVAPDLDGLSLAWGEAAYARWHHVLTHGLFAALVCSVVLGALARQRLQVALWSCLAFHAHLLCDLAGSGPGWPLVYGWPWSVSEVSWAGQWNLASWQNAVFGLGVTLGGLAAAAWVGRTPFELISARLDAAVVKTLAARFRFRR